MDILGTLNLKLTTFIERDIIYEKPKKKSKIYETEEVYKRSMASMSSNIFGFMASLSSNIFKENPISNLT